MPEIYVSTDIETDGPIPGPFSLLSLGAAAYRRDKTLVDTFAANLECLPGATQDPETMEWWESHPQAWAAARERPQPPEQVMFDYARWVSALPGKPVFVAYPAGFDFTFVYWYLMRFVGTSPFSCAALDIRSFAMGLMGVEYRQTRRRHLPEAWSDGLSHTHVALDDALEQGALFCNMLAAADGDWGGDSVASLAAPSG